LAPVSCILSFVCKSVFLVQNSFKHRNPCRCPVCIFFVSTRISIWTCDSVVRSIFRAQDDDVHTESRIYYCKQLDTTSRFGLSSYFTNSVEEFVDSIQRCCRSTHNITTRNVENNNQSRGTNYFSKTEIMWGDAHHIHQETKCEFQSNFSGGPFTFEKINLFHIK